MEDLKDYISDLVRFRKELSLNYSDDTILECATRMFNSQNIERAKRREVVREEKVLEPPTKKQIYALKKAGVTIPASKQEASLMISKLKGGKNGGF